MRYHNLAAFGAFILGFSLAFLLFYTPERATLGRGNPVSDTLRCQEDDVIGYLPTDPAPRTPTCLSPEQLKEHY